MRTRSYEAMFLLDNQAAQADWDATSGKVDTILEKHGARIVQKEKWDERKLAYEIKGQRRATYYLVYFDAPPASLRGIDEDLGLSESVLRHMSLALDEPIEELDARLQALLRRSTGRAAAENIIAALSDNPAYQVLSEPQVIPFLPSGHSRQVQFLIEPQAEDRFRISCLNFRPASSGRWCGPSAGAGRVC